MQLWFKDVLNIKFTKVDMHMKEKAVLNNTLISIFGKTKPNLFEFLNSSEGGDIYISGVIERQQNILSNSDNN